MTRGACWSLLQRPLLVAGVLIWTMLATSSALAGDADDASNKVRITGTVWLDENEDGIRQPGEPALPGVSVGIGHNFPSLSGFGADEQGRYSTIARVRQDEDGFRERVLIWSYYFEPGDAAVWGGGSASSTHWGCAQVYLAPELAGQTMTVDIRMVRFAGNESHMPPMNWPLADGHFFKENSRSYGRYHHCDTGFSVTNADGITFWDTWQRLGFERIGYPISHRFIWKGFVTQVFQRAVFQWRPGKGVFLVDIMDEMHDAGFDNQLQENDFIPKRLDTAEFDAGKGREEIQRDRLALLNANQAIKQRYYAVDDPLERYGLPTARIGRDWDVWAIRTQKAVFYEWGPGRRPSGVTLAHVGRIAERLGLFPKEMFRPQPVGFAEIGVKPAQTTRDWVKISGIVWIDENADGIRQTSEPVVPGAAVHVDARSWDLDEQRRIMVWGVAADDLGRYQYPWAYAEADFLMTVHYFKPGAEPVMETSADSPGPYTHSGCAHFYVTSGQSELTLDIRVSEVGRNRPTNSRPVADGRFFTNTSSVDHQECDGGFAVTNADGIPFFDTWRSLGWKHVGYPISHRFSWNGLVTQMYQKAILQWQPGKGVQLVNIFDELHEAGLDYVLFRDWDVPRPLDPSAFDAGKTQEEISRDRFALLDANPAIKEKFFAAPDPLRLFGLPTSHVAKRLKNREETVFVIRTQKAVFRHHANNDRVEVLNVGEIATELDANCVYRGGPGLCIQLFWSEQPLEDQGPVALMPQHIDLAGRQ